MTDRNKITIWALLFVSLLTCYYGFLSEMLPRGAGPDELAHLKAAQFIHEEGRLAVYPDDKEELHYSKHGATRSFRPPLVYIASALLHEAAGQLDLEFEKSYRKANAVLGAFCALFLLLALYTYTQRVGLAVFFTAAFALMPQVTFIFSYLNADGTAFMASSLILLSACVLLKSGVTLRSGMFFGTACGILSLCKITAWVFCLPICIYVVINVFQTRRGIAKPLLVGLLCFALVGGWRIAFNVYHHGLDDPFNLRVEAELREQYYRVAPEDVITYEVLDKDYLDLLSNYDNFLTRTYMSFVGHMDWLRLRVGPIQYAAYGAILVLGLAAVLWLFVKPVVIRDYDRSRFWFEASIVVGCLLQLFMYMRFNIHNDIQTQGKYILPAFTGYLLIAAAFARGLSPPYAGLNMSKSSRTTIFSASLLLVGYVHTQALYKYVIPFYFTGAYIDESSVQFKPISFKEPDALETGELKLVGRNGDSVKYEATGYDPRLTVNNVNIDLAPDLILIRIQVVSSDPGYYSFYWDSGHGMSERTSVTGFMADGENTIYQILPVSSVNHLRFDLGSPGTAVEIEEYEYGPLAYKPFVGVLNRLFNVRPTGDTL